MYETYLQNEREWEEEFGTLIDWGDGDLITKEQLKSKNRLSRIKEMKALEKELEGEKKKEKLGKYCKRCGEEIGYDRTMKEYFCGTCPMTSSVNKSDLVKVESNDFNQALQLSLDKIREFIKLLEKGV